MKNLHLFGAQLFQIHSQGRKEVAPMNKDSYADFAEYFPEGGEFPHMSILNIWVQHNVWEEVPKGKIFS